MRKNILIVEDEADIREILKFNLNAAEYGTFECGSAEDAERLLSKNDGIDLILLDVMLPGKSGFEFASGLRKQKEARNTPPIIFLTARNAENDLLTGFSTGGDDYISKPFSINEVLARIKAVLNRTSPPSPPEESEILDLGALKIDLKNKSVSVDGKEKAFSKKEYEILLFLASKEGKTVSRSDFIKELWQDAPYVLNRTIDVHIARIRSKLGKHRDIITNRAGFGYCLQRKDEI